MRMASMFSLRSLRTWLLGTAILSGSVAQAGEYPWSQVETNDCPVTTLPSGTVCKLFARGSKGFLIAVVYGKGVGANQTYLPWDIGAARGLCKQFGVSVTLTQHFRLTDKTGSWEFLPPACEMR